MFLYIRPPTVFDRFNLHIYLPLRAINKFFMKRLILLFSVLLMSLFSFAGTGDTTWVRVHNATELTWWGGYNDYGNFPDGSTEYRRVLMNYTMGCPSTGCSNWDYTTKITLKLPNGTFDTTIASIDTLSQNPLVIDTSYNITERKTGYELGRVITPYGTYMNYTSPQYGTAGYNDQWKHTWTFDVTDFAHLLQGDSLQVEAFFAGYDGALGFTCTLDFAFIEGTPPRRVLGLENLYNGSYGYSTTADFESTKFVAKNFNLPLGTKYSKLRFLISGHGIDNLGCGEFCPREYYVKVNGAQKHERLFWRDDCGDLAIAPQGGTWIFNRGNWCPGDKVYTDHWSITDPSYASTAVSVDVDLEPWDGDGGTPSYITYAALVSYEDFNFINDAAVETIKAPSEKDNFRRFNPMCDNPMVTISNQGKSDLSYLEIAYGVVGGDTCWYKWSGNLAHGEQEDVTLPTFNWNGLNSVNPQFFALASWPNGQRDEYPYDNSSISNFNLPPVYDSVFVLFYRTNNHPEENWYVVRDESGNVVYSKDNFNANEIYRDTLSFQPGCYTLEFFDYDSGWGGGDGLSWWFNLQNGYETGGSIQLRYLVNSGSGFVLESINPDFGNKVFRAFTVGYQLGQGPAKPACAKPVHNVGIENAEETGSLEIFPNPSNGLFHLDVTLPQSEELNFSVIDMQGREIQSFQKVISGAESFSINLDGNAAGVYLLKVDGIQISRTYKLNLSTY